MIQSLNTVKKQHMHHLVANTDDNYVSDYIEDDVNQGSNNTFIQRKIHPEKQALNAEELQILIDNDVLTKEQLKDEQLHCDPENSEKKTDLETQISETDAARWYHCKPEIDISRVPDDALYCFFINCFSSTIFHGQCLNFYTDCYGNVLLIIFRIILLWYSQARIILLLWPYSKERNLINSLSYD